MKINSMNTFEHLPQFELVEEFWKGGLDMNIQGVGIVIKNINTGKQYVPKESYFEHGIDEYFIDDKALEESDENY